MASFFHDPTTRGTRTVITPSFERGNCPSTKTSIAELVPTTVSGPTLLKCAGASEVGVTHAARRMPFFFILAETEQSAIEVRVGGC